MPRPAVASPADVRHAALALVAEAGLGQAPSAQAFRRAVSVRKVRERLGGGNPVESRCGAVTVGLASLLPPLSVGGAL